MNRRSYLAAFAGGASTVLSGCVGGLPPLSGGLSVQRLVRLVDVDAIDWPFRFDVDPVDRVVTAEETAHLRITVTNETDDRYHILDPGLFALYNGGSDDPRGLWLYERGMLSWIEREDDRWTRDKPPDYRQSYPAVGGGRLSLDGGRSISYDYLVWDNYRVEGYMPLGTYRFEERVHLAGPEQEWEREFTLGLSLEVIDPTPSSAHA